MEHIDQSPTSAIREPEAMQPNTSSLEVEDQPLTSATSTACNTSFATLEYDIPTFIEGSSSSIAPSTSSMEHPDHVNVFYLIFYCNISHNILPLLSVNFTYNTSHRFHETYRLARASST